MVEKVKRWFEIMPGWVPICITILSATMWLGRYSQSIEDRVKAMEEQIKAIQEYLRTHHTKNDGDFVGRDYDSDKRPPQSAYEPVE